MSNSKETMSAYQRWEMTSFGDERPSVVASRQPLAPQVELPTESQVAAIFEQARLAGLEEGRQQGFQEGLAIGRDEAAAELQYVQQIAAEFNQAVTRADETIASDLLELALNLAKSMLRTALDVRPELVLAVVREAIDYLPVVQQPALLMLNPLDADLVRESLGDELGASGWRIVEDHQIARGGCKLDTPHNQIDAQTASRWNRIAHALGKNTDWLG